MRRPSTNQKRPSEDYGDEEGLSGENNLPHSKRAHVDTDVTAGNGEEETNADSEVTANEEDSYDEDLLVLEEECGKEKLDITVIKSLMAKTLLKRRQWIKDSCPKVEEILAKFPPLCKGLKKRKLQHLL